MNTIAVNEAALNQLWRHTPRMTVAQAMTMPWGPERNLALRKALAVPFPSDTTVLVTQHDVIQIVTPPEQRADSLAHTITTDLPGWTVTTHRNSDRNHVVQAHR